MIRFVDLTDAYWLEPNGEPCCAFLDTIDDTFVVTDYGGHVFTAHGDFPDNDLGRRLRALVPEHFFEPRTQHNGERR